MTSSIEEHFSQLEAPRVERNQLHGFMGIPILVICAVTSGAEGWEAIEQFGRPSCSGYASSRPLPMASPLTIVLPTSSHGSR